MSAVSGGGGKQSAWQDASVMTGYPEDTLAPGG